MYDGGSRGGTSGEEDDLQEILAGSWQSTTPASKPMTHDKIYYFLPYWDDKPCLHVRSIWPDYRRRMYNSNIIGKIVDKLVRIYRFQIINHNYPSLDLDRKPIFFKSTMYLVKFKNQKRNII